jgi:DNA repair protein RecN (Recombination protein N)
MTNSRAACGGARDSASKSMLSEIHIRDFALIDKLDLEFQAGFSVLTGETGAGKSIIIDAISATLGERLSADIIRTGADKALIEAVFDVSDAPQVKGQAASLDVEIEDDTVFLSREISRAGKSQCRVNGRLCPLSTLRQLTDGLLDLHGQHEHQTLLSADTHLEAYDNWLGAEALRFRSEVGRFYATLKDVQRHIDELRRNERERAHMLDLYRFQFSEIESAQLIVGEEQLLEADRTRLANAEKLHTLASGVCELLSSEAGSALTAISQAARQAEQMAAVDPTVGEASEMLRNAVFSAEEAHATTRIYRDSLEFNPQRLESIEERLDLIRTLKRKYGDSVEEILAYADDIAAKVRDMEHREERGAELQAQLERAQSEANEAAGQLSQIRKSHAAEFATAVTNELGELAMERTQFRVSIDEDTLSPTGIDNVEFLISPNPGEPLKPLVRIASGGEMSRLMLALKSVMAIANRVPTVIFDEIDTGIGGRTANVIGDKLASLSESSQIMCVTHLPQIASRARTHLSVSKDVENGRTVVRVTPLEADDRAQEVARMLGSTEGNAETALQHAREMLRASAS